MLVDFYLMDTSAGANGFDITYNAWDHDAATPVPGPTIYVVPEVWPVGTDILYSPVLNIPPAYVPFNPAVAGGCSN